MDVVAQPDATSSPQHRFLTLLAWFVAYLAAGALVVMWQPANGASVWYPPIAIGMALLLRRGTRYLPVVFVADFLVALPRFDLGWTVAMIVAGNTAMEVFVAVALLRFLRFDATLRSGTDFLWLVLAAGCVAVKSRLFVHPLDEQFRLLAAPLLQRLNGRLMLQSSLRDEVVVG